jgi:hypothetical protein
MAEPTFRGEAPRRRERLGGLFAVADVRDGGMRLINGANLQYDQNGCGTVHEQPFACWGEVVADAEKQRDGVESGTGVVPAFGLYAGVECFAGPHDSEYEPRARGVLEWWESRGVEGKLNGWLGGATDSAASDLVAAIAAADNHADDTYIGLPIIHLNRADAEVAFKEGALRADERGNLTTGHGTPVAASARYTAGVVAVTGDVTVLRSGMEAHRSIRPELNKTMAIAERGYAIAVDCDYRAKFTVTAP